jgi:hypothetical protein
VFPTFTPEGMGGKLAASRSVHLSFPHTASRRMMARKARTHGSTFLEFYGKPLHQPFSSQIDPLIVPEREDKVIDDSGSPGNQSGNDDPFSGMGAELLLARGRGHGRGHGHGHGRGHHERTHEPPKEPPPSLQAMLTQSVDLGRIAKSDPKAPDFKVERTDEGDFKARYVSEALRVGRQVGFDTSTTKDLVRRIYAFEAGGWGTADTLSGMRESMMSPESQHQRETLTPASSAVGYNQVIRPTTLHILHRASEKISDRLEQLAEHAPSEERRQALQEKATLVRGVTTAMDKAAAGLPDAPKLYDNNGAPTWKLYAKLVSTDSVVGAGLTGRQMSNAIHALNLDKDIGPLIQAENLRMLMEFAQQNNIRTMLQDRVKTIKTRGKEFDALDPEQKTKAIDEVIQTMKESTNAGFEGDSPEGRAKLAAADSIRSKLVQLKPGDDYALDRMHLTPEENRMVRAIIGHAGGLDSVPKKYSADAKKLVGKIIDSHFRGSMGDELLPAALELGNLVGTGRALHMLQPDAASKPAKKFFSGPGYRANPIAHHKTASQLLMAIYRRMNNSEYGRSKQGLTQLMYYLDNANDKEE